ncbi:MAG TPA: hypothetical protein VEB22_09225 [Phycisphaerales bacterium]|nr:hypothetical protein [Phycisphaerales bacterium]
MVVVGRMLATSGEALLGSLRSPVRTSSDLIKAAGVNKDIASRFLSALSKRDPMAVAYYMPGVESLRRLSRGAKSRSGDALAIKTFDAAISAFEEFLQDELGGRHALDAMASAWLPEARERFEFASRQMAFRASANLRGLECRTLVNAGLIAPGADADRYDAVALQGLIGIQRLRPAVSLTVATYDRRGDTAGRPNFTIDGRPIAGEELPHELLPAFSRGEPLDLRVVRRGSSAAFQLVGTALGASAAGDSFFGVYSPGLFRRWARFPGDRAAHMEVLEVPTQRLVLDVLLHEDVWPGRDPELLLYETCVRGTASVNEPARNPDRVDMLDTARLIGRGVDCCRVAETPRYLDLLHWTCEQRGWDQSKFRVYRCDARYPVVGVQYTMAFGLPERPTA